jgi:hypothetical protein
MAVHPDWVTVHGAIEAGCFELGERAGQDLVTGPPGPRLLEENVLEPIGVGQRLFESRWHVGFALAEDIALVLGIGVHPERGDADIAPENVTSLNDRVLAQLIGRDALPLNRD